MISNPYHFLTMTPTTTWLDLRIAFPTIGVDVFNLVTYLNHAHKVELYDVRDGSKNIYQKDMHF